MPTKTRGEDKVAKLAKLAEQLREGVAAQFRRYSVHNTFLILLQKPDATRVAGYKTWQTLGRQGRKGEQGIAILAPVTVEDADTGEQVRRVVALRGATVFDLSQTDGEPLPQDPQGGRTDRRDEPDGLWDAMTRQAADAGFTVTLAAANSVVHAHRRPRHGHRLGHPRPHQAEHRCPARHHLTHRNPAPRRA